MKYKRSFNNKELLEKIKQLREEHEKEIEKLKEYNEHLARSIKDYEELLLEKQQVINQMSVYEMPKE